MKRICTGLVTFALSSAALFGQLLVPSQQATTTQHEPAPWHDPSPHRIQFVTVDEGVQLEVLDWGGSGRPLILLSGLGNTAHIFDDFAPKLTGKYHVYGITRRGYGASSSPVTGYIADRLGDDVIAVLDALKIEHPVLVGHSFAGEELSSVGTRYPDRIAGLVYLDAAYEYAYYDPARGDLQLDLNDLQKELEALQKNLEDKKRVQELLHTDLPRFERDLQEQQKNLDVIPPASAFSGPTATDRASYPAFRTYLAGIVGGNIPEAELRQENEAKPDGSVGSPHVKRFVTQAIQAGVQKYTDIHVPVLAIYAIPRDHGSSLDHVDPTLRAKIEDRETAVNEDEAKSFEQGVPSARVVRLAHANHVDFLSNEVDVLREIDAFIGSLP
jgi:non-heme chloroperoxidase